MRGLVSVRELTQEHACSSSGPSPSSLQEGQLNWGLVPFSLWAEKAITIFHLKKVFLSIPGGIDQTGGVGFSLSRPAGGI